MALTVANLQSLGGTGAGPNFFTYISASEALATIEASGYFDAVYQKFRSSGDYMLVQGSDGTTLNTITVTSGVVTLAAAGLSITKGTVAKAGATLAVPITARYVAMTTGGAEALTLANGVPGQRINLALVSDGGTGTLTPATCSGFATIVFADEGDVVDLEYVNDTVGWILVGSAGVAAPPVTTV